MAGYDIRSLADLAREARGFFTQSIPGAILALRPNTFTVFAKVLALLNFEHELRRKWLFKQTFASSADAVWLARHGFELGLAQSPGSAALGRVVISAPSGVTVPSGLTFQRADGLTYTTVSGGTSTGAALVAFIEADLVGAAGNLDAGTTLDLTADVDGPVGMAPVVTVFAADDGTGLSGGADAEDIEAFRARVLARKRQPPQGGSAADYQTWAFEALPSSVRSVHVDTFANDMRSIWVAFTVSDRPDGIPTSGQIATVQGYVDDPLRRPVTARAFVVVLTPLPVPVTIAGLAPDTPDVRESIEAEIAALFVDRAEPGTPSAPFVLSRSWIAEAIARATGEDRHVLVQPAADLVFASGFIPVPGPISYTD